MVTKTLKTSSGPLKVTIPGHIKELTLEMMVAISPKPGHSYSQLEQLSILSGVPLEGKEDEVCLYDLTDIEEIHTFDVTLQKLAFQIIAFRDTLDIPKGVILDIPQNHTKKWYALNRKHVGKYVPVIDNLGIQPAGAYMEAKELIKDEYDEWERVKKEHGDHIEFSPSVDSMIRLLSLYFYVPATGNKFHPERVAEFDEVVKKLPITQALPIAKYFFLRFPNLSKPKPQHLMAKLKELKLKQE